MNTWKDKIEEIIANGGTDSDIEEYLYKHPNFNVDEVWAYIEPVSYTHLTLPTKLEV